MVDLNHQFHPGDRVRYETVGEDGFPLVRYGFVGGQTHGDGPVVVMLDGELGGDVVDLGAIEPVDISNVVLKLGGADLLDDPGLRAGLVQLWRAEAEDAGLQIGSIQPTREQTPTSDETSGCRLAELTAGGRSYVLNAAPCPSEDAVLISATRPRPWLV